MQEHEPDQKPLPECLRYFVFAILAFTIISLGQSLIARHLGFGLPSSYPYYFSPGTFFYDYYGVAAPIAQLGRPDFLSQSNYFMYPPAMVLPVKVLYIASHSGKVLLMLLFASGAFFTFCLYRILRASGLVITAALLLTTSIAVTSYPFLFLLQRWNMEIFAWIFVTTGIWCFYRGHYRWAAFCFGLATALKLYPFIFFGLFLPRRRYLDVLLGAFTAGAFTLIGLRMISPDILRALSWDTTQLAAFGKYYAGAPLALGYDHSFFALVKFALLPWTADLTPLVRPYTWLAAASCLALYFGRIWKLPLPNQILILSVLSVSIAPVSYDYTLLSLYASLAILCVIALKTSRSEQWMLTPFFLLYAVILTPQSYIIFHGARFCGELRALCLLALLVLAIRKPLPAESSDQHHGESRLTTSSSSLTSG
jgi:hypothetical protein